MGFKEILGKLRRVSAKATLGVADVMAKNKIKKIFAIALSFVMTICSSAYADSSQTIGTDAAKYIQWEGFSVLTYDGTYGDYTTGDYRWANADPSCETKGYITEVGTDFVKMHVVNTGGDAIWAPVAGATKPSGNNPWGLTITGSGINVKKGMSYTMSFDVDSTLEDKKQSTLNKIKHFCTKIYEPGNGDPSCEYISVDGCSKDGMSSVEAGTTKHIEIVFSVRDDYEKKQIGLKIALGAFLYDYPEEVAYSGDIMVSNFKVNENTSIEIPETPTSESTIKPENNSSKNLIQGNWDSYFGYNSGWYEGADGEVLENNNSNWIVSMNSLGWGGIWGAQITHHGINLIQDKEYVLNFSIQSRDCDKWVYVAIRKDLNSTDIVWSKWIHLAANKINTINDKLKVSSSDEYSMVYGIGGEFGDRDDEANIYEGLTELPNDGDSMSFTTITCTDISIAAYDPEHKEAIEWTIIKRPTCTEAGEQVKYCEVCGDVLERKIIPPLGHSFTHYISNGDATCTKDGTKTAICNYCNTKDTIIDVGSAKGHNTKILNKKAPTYFEKGYTGDKVCIVCNKTITKGKTIARLVLKRPVIKVKSQKKALAVSFAKVKGATKYEIKIKVGKKSKTYSTKNQKYTVKKLNSKKSYQIKVRAYVQKGNLKAYSSYSKLKKVKTK